MMKCPSVSWILQGWSFVNIMLLDQTMLLYMQINNSTASFLLYDHRDHILYNKNRNKPKRIVKNQLVKNNVIIIFLMR